MILNQYGELTGYSASAGSVLYSYTNTFDALGRVSARSETIGGTTTQFAYQYDLAGRLTGVIKNGTRVSEYRYDANSNRTLGATASGVSRGRYDKQDRMLAYGHAHHTYTPNGELGSKSEGGLVTKYTYDVLGNLIGVSSANTSITYLIDARNRRGGGGRQSMVCRQPRTCMTVIGSLRRWTGAMRWWASLFTRHGRTTRTS
jgi:YD repeat-containing protein